MLRQLASRVARIGSRGISTTSARLEGEAAPSGLKEFSEAWIATAPSTMAVPDTNASFLEQPGDGQSLADGDRFPVNFYTPYGVIAESKVSFKYCLLLETYRLDSLPVPIVFLQRAGSIDASASLCYCWCDDWRGTSFLH
jgi:hypothetical protein